MINSPLFFVFLLSSFLVGGIVVTLLTVIAEKTNREFAGIIISIPSTIFISFLFIGLSEGLDTIKTIIPGIPIALSNMLVFISVYVMLGRQINPRNKAMLISSLVSIAVWITLSIVIISVNIHNLTIAISIYILFVIGLTFLFNRFKDYNVLTERFQIISVGEKIFRFILSGIIISLAVLFSRLLDPLWGGLFSVFPAVYFSSLLIFHRRYESRHLINFAESIPVGSLILLLFASFVYLSIDQFGLFLSLITALILSTGFSWVLMKLYREFIYASKL